MATRVNGRNGAIYVGIASSSATPEPLPFAKKWTLDMSTSMDDATAFGDGNNIATQGLPAGTGTFEGFYDADSAQTYTAASDGVARRCYFYPTTPSNTGPYWYGTAFFDFTVEADVTGGTVPISGNFAAASDLTKIG